MKSILIIGNGKSRLNPSIKKFIEDWKNPVWACNLSFREENIGKHPNLELMASVHHEVIQEAIGYRKNNNFNFKILCPMPKFNVLYNIDETQVKPFNTYYGYSTGNELIMEALDKDYTNIILVGFDSLNNNNSDVYGDKVVINNFKNQMNHIIKSNNLKLKKYLIYNDIWELRKNI